MENESFAVRFKTSSMRFLRRLMIWGSILIIAVGLFLYFGTYENGVMAGRVLRISEKGVVFKTYEGKISLGAFGALQGVSPIAETYDFSVESSQIDVIRELQEVALKQEQVNLHYKKRYLKFPWRGETRVFVVRVERVK